MYCINWRKYERLVHDGKRYWDDGIADGLSELLTLKLGVYLTLEPKKPGETEEAQETKSGDINVDTEQEPTHTQEQPPDKQEE